MNWMPILIQLISGGVGGNIAGALLKKFNLGPIGNTIAGILGGVGGGQLLSYVDRSRCPGRKRRAGYVFDPLECRWRWCWRGGDHGHRGTGQSSDGEIGYGLNQV